MATIATRLNHTTRRLWATLAVLVLAGIAAIVVLMNTGGSDTTVSPGTHPGGGTGQHVQQRLDCRPGNVPRPC